MTTYEKINELRAQATTENYSETEMLLVSTIGEFVKREKVECVAHGIGQIVDYHGTTVENITVDIQFADCTKRFSLKHIIEIARFVKFVNPDEINEIWKVSIDTHNELTSAYNEIQKQIRQAEREAQKKAEADKKAEEKYQKAKTKAINDFEALTKTTAVKSSANEFYYTLGWLAKNAGTVSAALPDYLLNYFEKHFGSDYNPTVVDSKKRTINGNPMQWALSMKVSLVNKADDIPVNLSKYLSSNKKALTNTSFVWDLIDNYGFQFGKKQSIEKIKSCVPEQYITSFEAGLTC